ncbi:MAG: hypothetical protein EZS28_008903 [Streblomastix strix]|uniref:CSC1/OSCA1-like 7TM region domain-containing protein n=1 Tax=Streblomastix strix TaxID=222440 RepID=A0A5J4WL46_9EUKA|nr:MAG: hypothetical protein EZS28_008903 [Streblomastix strix]
MLFFESTQIVHRILYHLPGHIFAGSMSMHELNVAFLPPEQELDDRLADIIKIVYEAFLLAPFIPVIIPFVFLYFLAMFWINKVNILRFFKAPAHYSKSITDSTVKYLEYAFHLFCLSTIVSDFAIVAQNILEQDRVFRYYVNGVLFLGLYALLIVLKNVLYQSLDDMAKIKSDLQNFQSNKDKKVYVVAPSDEFRYFDVAPSAFQPKGDNLEKKLSINALDPTKNIVQQLHTLKANQSVAYRPQLEKDQGEQENQVDMTQLTPIPLSAYSSEYPQQQTVIQQQQQQPVVQQQQQSASTYSQSSQNNRVPTQNNRIVFPPHLNVFNFSNSTPQVYPGQPTQQTYVQQQQRIQPQQGSYQQQVAVDAGGQVIAQKKQ